jgi:hypothetical protein
MEEFKKIKEQNIIHLENIKKIVNKYTTKPEGNCMWYHETCVEAEELYNKQYNLYYLGSISTEIMEIGFNAGHSCLLMLLGNSNSKITIFDICIHEYTIPCFEYLNEHFPNRLELIKGNSLETVPKYKLKKFDLLHIDGYHEAYHVIQDIMNSRQIAKQKGIVILDDDWLPWLNKLHRELIDSNILEILNDSNLLETKLYTHLVCRYK